MLQEVGYAVGFVVELESYRGTSIGFVRGESIGFVIEVHHKDQRATLERRESV